METLLQDIRFALRSLVKSPGFTVAAVGILALGIGANTTVFSLVNAIHLRHASFPAADRLVDLQEWSATRLCTGCSVGTSYPTFLDWRAQATSFTGMAAYGEGRFVAVVDGTPTRVGGARVSPALFGTLGVRPALGRDFFPEEEEPGAGPVVILGHDLWNRAFGADSAVIGRVIALNGEAYSVIGVMPGRFQFPEFSDLWIPLRTSDAPADRSARDLGVVARLKPGVSLDQATTEMATIAGRLEQEYPASQKEWSARAVSLREDMASDVGPYFWILMGAVGLVLLVSCANLAGLMLARAARRQREMAIRVAVGAGRGRLVRQLLTESIVVALLGGTAGLLLALWAVDLVSARTAGLVPYWIEFGIDGRVLAFCATATLLTGILFGLAPALRASRPDLHEALKEGAPQGSPGRHRLRVMLVIAEVALALVLLNAAGVMVKAVLRVTEPPAGYDSRGLLQADMEYLGDRFADSGAVAEATGEIVRRLDAAPGVRAAARRTWFIAGFGARDQKIAVEGPPEVPDGASPRFGFAVTPGYFETLGLELVAGRTFEAGDDAGAAPVAVINRTMADAVWPGGSPLGRRIRLGGPGSGLPWVTVVGVVSNETGEPRAGQRPRSDVYMPLAQNPGRPVQFLVRGSRDHDRLAPLLRASIRAVAPDEPVERIQSAEAAIAQQFWPWRAMATMLTAFAVFAVVLAMIGIYGVVAYAVSQRRQEIGVRMALGERRERIVGLIVADGARLVGAGIIVGLIISLMVTRVMRSLLFGSNPVDPAVIAGVALLLAVSATVASWLPALRATRVDPMASLRTE